VSILPTVSFFKYRGKRVVGKSKEENKQERKKKVQQKEATAN